MTNCVHDHRHWADKWGEGDQIGAGALLTPANTLQALREVQRGRSGTFPLRHRWARRASSRPKRPSS